MSLLPLLVISSFTLLSGEEWPHIRGPKLDGRAQAAGLFEGENVGFVPAWTAPLGSSYAGIVVGDGKVVTTLSDGAEDVLIALKESDGEEVWRLSLGPTYRGHDGSDDGVISTPILHGGQVFALTPFGSLMSVSLDGGEKIWSIDLRESLGAPLPEHGFGSTPIVENGQLIVQVGGPKSLCSFNPATGELNWSAGDGEVWYQSPLAMDLAGRRQLVVLAREEVHGLDPADGSVLWRHTLGRRGQAQTGIATPIDENRFIASVSGQISMIEVTSVDGEFQVQEQFRSRELGRSYATPVYYDGYLYGFKSDFLTCVDATTGRRIWKSRPPGGRGLIGVEDRLLIFGSQGVAVIAKATPEGYVEEDRIQALESTGYSWPSFASNSIYLRNLESIARVAIRNRTAVAVNAGATKDVEAQHAAAFERFQAMIPDQSVGSDGFEAVLEQMEGGPLVEDGYAHLLFQGEVEDVAVSFSGLDASQVLPMQRLGDSNVYYRGFSVVDGQRYEYRFQADFGAWQADDRNPQKSPALRGSGEVSSLLTAGFQAREPFAPQESVAKGTLDEFDFEAKSLGNTRKVRVYTPAGYDAKTGKYPLLIVHQGQSWVTKGRLTETVDNLVGKSIRPIVIAFIDPIRRSWLESGGTGTDAYLDSLCNEFLPELARRYSLSDDPADRALMGVTRFGVTAAYGVLRHPDVFSKAVIQSVDLGDVTQYALFQLIEESNPGNVTFYVDWNRFEDRNIDRGYDKGEDSLRLYDALKAKGHQLSGQMYPDSNGWGSWRSRADLALEALFPL